MPTRPRLRRPGLRPAKIQIAAGIDREVRERRQLARGEIDGEALGDRAEIERSAAAAA